MAITSSGNANGIKLASGPLKVKDILINPTLKELQKYGVTHIKDEQDYSVENEDRGKGVALTIWMKIDPVNFTEDFPEQPISHKFYLFDTPRVSQNGLIQWTNKFGNFTWAKDENSLHSSFKKDGLRKAGWGEEDLINFIKAWGNVKRDDECQLETFDKIVTGDVSELKKIEKAWESHKLIAAVGLNDRGNDKFYMTVYPKSFWRHFVDKIRIKDGDEWVDKTFEEGLPILFNQDYSEFTKADKMSYVPKIWTLDELKSVEPTSEQEVNTNSNNEVF